MKTHRILHCGSPCRCRHPSPPASSPANAARLEHKPPRPPPAHAGKDLVAVASGADNFKTLVAAVKAAGLVETLQGKGPFTVFRSHG